MKAVVPPSDLSTVVSNIGCDERSVGSLHLQLPGMHTAFVQVGLKEDHRVSSYIYMDQVKRRIDTAIA